jgi:F-type H+-transporting ATPase subunit b
LIPDLSVLWVIVFVLMLSVLLDRLLLRPLTRVMSERDGAMRAARELADSSRARAQAAADEFEARTRAARAEVYQMMEEKRRSALDRRAQLVAETRAEVERTVSEATARVAAQAAAARESLERDSDALASSIVERLLGRKAF